MWGHRRKGKAVWATRRPFSVVTAPSSRLAHLTSSADVRRCGAGDQSARTALRRYSPIWCFPVRCRVEVVEVRYSSNGWIGEIIMRATKTRSGLKVYAVSGTYVVMLGFDLPLRSCRGLRGFSIHRANL